MMDYGVFKGIVKEQFLSYMPPEFQTYKLDIYSVNKINKVMDALTLYGTENEASKASPTLYIENMYEHYLKNQNFDETMKQAASDLVSMYRALSAELGEISLNYAEEKIIMTLINTEQNREFLQQVPHREFEDLSIVYRHVLSIGKDGVHSIMINNHYADKIGMTEEQLHDAAVINTKRLFPPVVKSMSDMIRDIFRSEGVPEEAIDKMVDNEAEGKGMYVITNNHTFYGAASMLYEEELHKLAEKMGSDMYILPSSIQEVIAIPVSEGDPYKLAEMVEEVNMSTVDLEERLSNQVYHYDKDLRQLTLATETQNKRLDGIVAEAPLVYEAKQSR